MNPPTDRFDSRSKQLSSPTIACRLLFITAIIGIATIHIGLIICFDNPALFIDGEPISGGNYDTHLNQTFHVIEGLEVWKRHWVYDPHLLAGYPTGTISDCDNKAWSLWTFALWKLGLTKGVAYSSFVLLAHLLVLPIFFFAAKLFGLNGGASLSAMAMGSAIWFFDSMSHWLWWNGILSYAMASYLSILPLALFYRFLQDRRFWQVLLLAVMVGIVHLVHPYSFIILFLPMMVLYIQHFRQLSPLQHAKISIVPLVTIAINSYWLVVAVEFWRYITRSGYASISTLKFFPADFFSLLIDPAVTGIIGTRTGFRFLALSLAFVMLFIWKRKSDQRFLTFTVAFGWLFSLAYISGYFKTFSQYQLYHFITPAAFLAVIPAASLMETAWQNRKQLRAPRVVVAAVVILMIPGIQHFSKDVLYYFTDLLPPIPPSMENMPIFLTPAGYGPHPTYRRTGIDPKEQLLPQWVAKQAVHPGRFLVQFAPLGERLAWKTNAEIIGGFPFRNLIHSYSNFFKLQNNIDYNSPFMIRDYLESYAIKWVIINVLDPRLRQMKKFVKYHKAINGLLVFKTNTAVNLFQSGNGSIRAMTNRIEVRNTYPHQDIIIRYNWLHTLVCEPNCTIKPSYNKFSQTGFIRIPAPHPSSFLIRNAYK